MRYGVTLSGGIRRFLHRRAWRILPAYWAALILSIAITALLLRPDYGPGAMAQTLFVHGLLLQDVVGSQSPNGALWSIAIEWQIYFVFPLILLVARRTSLVTAVLITFVVVFTAHAAAGLGWPLEKINGLTPQFLALFALGTFAVWLGSGDHARALRLPLGAVAAATVSAFVILAVIQGSEWMVANFFWMDLLFGGGFACMLAMIHGGALSPVRRVLASRAGLWFGLFSYSIYLIHAPLLGVLNKYAIAGLEVPQLVRFGLTVAIGLPVIIACCYGFHLAFEAPFLRHRSLAALRTMPILRLVPTTRNPVDEKPAAAMVSAPQPATADQAAR
jgi:peptidoglycan/LPS O-acetylase OafA/YrhL